MKKFLLFLVLLPFFTFLQAQNIEKADALSIVEKNAAAIGLSAEDLRNVSVSNAYISNPSGIEMVYLQQTYLGLPVLNKLHVLAFRNGALVSKSGGGIKGIAGLAGSNLAPTVTAANAVQTAMADKKIHSEEKLIPSVEGNKISFGKLGIASENVTAELMWVPAKDGSVRLAWQVYLVPKTTPDYFLIMVDAINNSILEEINLTAYDNWNTSKATVDKKHFAQAPQKSNTATVTSPSIVNGASYRVIPFPAESPIHPGGAPALVTDPWNAAPGNATSLKWHSTGTTDYNITRGNNVWAREDRLGTATVDNPGVPATSTTPDPLTFNFTPDFTILATQTTPVPNQQFGITNLFYWNNIIHDVVYQYGFDEASGNFQANNQGRGGVGNDYVNAQAQDGGGTNNANFSTPADGSIPRMQMYLWEGAIVLANTPPAVAGPYKALESGFSTANKLKDIGPKTGDVVYYNDNAAGTTHEGCTPPANSLTGKIALIMRGNCNFTVKVKNAQDAGAIGVIMINNVPGDPIIMGGGPDATITIPAVMIRDVDGATLVAQLGNNLNVTLKYHPVDGDLDNGVVIHEFSHGISNRLTGGPAQAGCLGSAEQQGEGWSDYYALMLTQDWANSNVNSGFTTPRALGAYDAGQEVTGPGIRSQRYSTDFSVNNLVFGATIPAESHDRGEIWCATLWDMTWNIIQQVNNINPNIYNVAGGGGNTIALRLVTEGLKLQPCGPGFIDSRNAILQADQVLYNGAYNCAIREAFRRRGMGPLASQGSAGSVTDQVPDFSAALTVKLTQNLIQVQQGQNIVYTNTVTTCSPVTNYLLTDTLPSNVTYVSGGTYNATNRVVSFPITLTQGQTQTYSFTVSVNAGSYFATTNLFNEPFAAATMPASLTPTSNTTTVWNVTNAQSHSAPNSVFSPNIATPSDQTLTTTNGLALGTNPSQLSFWHSYNTEAGYDGGVAEISTDGGTTWLDLGVKMNLNGYNSAIDPTAGTTLAGRKAFTGNSSGFVKTSVNLTSFVNQTAKFRWKFSSDNGGAAVGWYVDDIDVTSEPLVHMRSSLFSTSGTRLSYSDTVTLIIQAAVCTNISITTQPANANTCSGTSATFTVVAAGNAPSYQWQVSTDGGINWTNITGATSASVTIPSVTPAMNNYRYRVVVNNACPSSATSNAAILTVSDPASITTQPASITVCAGSNASFTVVAAGTNITYQWQVSTDGGLIFTNITGATSAALNLTAVTASMNANQYHVVISGCNPVAVTSNNVTLTVNSPAVITAQPVNTNACTGGNATITVTATGTAISYQWQVSTDGGTTWTNITGATTANLTLTGVTSAMNNYRYRVIVNNACPSTVTSTAVTLSVSDPASITGQPANVTICSGSTAAFTVVASGTNITYQWQVSTDGGTTFTNMTGATAATLTITGVPGTANGNIYHVVVFSCSPTGLNSNNVTLTVNTPPVITTQPVNVTACAGGNASFTVPATGTALTYQWQVSTDGGTTYTNITGQTSATLSLTAVTAAMNNNRYRLIFNGTCPGSVTSNAAVLTVSAPAVISTHPSNATACAGTTATFTVTATGVTTYQWQVSTNGGTSYTDIAGATGPTLSIAGITAAMNANRYRVVITGCGSVTSSAATLTANALPVVSIAASPSVNIMPGNTTTLTATSTPAASIYSWFKNGVLLPGSATSSIVVAYAGLGDYTASVTDINGCSNTSNLIKIGDSTVNTSFIYPNPNNGLFYVRYNAGTSLTQTRVINMFDAKGQKVYSQVYVVAPTQEMKVVSNRLASGTYMVELLDANGIRLKQGKVIIH